MLRTWLTPLSVDEFVTEHLGRTPFARPRAAIHALSLFDWSALGRILAAVGTDAQAAPDMLVASAGRLVDAPEPRTLDQVYQLMMLRFGLVVRKAERHDAHLAELAQSFARDLPGEIHVQLYVTPADTHTFGWHYDEEDVFIVQTVGTKDYYMRQNTVAPIQRHGAPDFSAVRQETSPLLTARLVPGDWLYIPSRWWHLVHSVEDALSISIGVTTRNAGLRSIRTG